jgi:multidrug resistance efflux pump
MSSANVTGQCHWPSPRPGRHCNSAFLRSREELQGSRRPDLGPGGGHRSADHRRCDAKQSVHGKFTPAAAFEKAKRDVDVTTAMHAALLHRQAAVEVELAALQQGIFIGDSYNDRPRSAQRADELGEKLSEVKADIREREGRLAGLRQELQIETDRFAAQAAAEITTPVRGSVWEVLTSPGETVVRGQELVRMLDCAGVVVTATVGETAYNRLHMGGPARFRFRGGSQDYAGRVIGLTGVVTAPANLGIEPAALAKEPYRATVALPELVTPGQCDVGRTGRVTFGK